MSIIIRGMEMPKQGRVTLQIGADGAVYVVDKCEITAEKYEKNFEVFEVPCDYDELLKAARAMHTWIFLHSGDENMAYKACRLSDEMNAFLGYSGSLTLTL